MPKTACVLVLAMSIALVPRTVSALAKTHDLSLAERVEAQRAIEAVTYAHRIGTTRPFAEAVPRGALEQKVRRYLKESAALDKWNDAITAGDLAAELRRTAAATRMPDRLLDLFHALGDDPVLIQECLIRPVLAEKRLVQHVGQTALDAWWAANEGLLDENRVVAVASSSETLPVPASAPCVDDAWQNGVLDDGPDPQAFPTSVWTGSELIIWGGDNPSPNNDPVNTGWRYNPATNGWTKISTTGAPSARTAHVAVWTGSAMIVWGGLIGTTGTGDSTGGRYDPATDTWSATSTLNAPGPRGAAVAVWTGSQMIVWGGTDFSTNGPLANGGRYDPASDSWSAMATTGVTGQATAIWTGSRMVVWGTYAGRYDPVSDTWSGVSTINEPAFRSGHTAVWTGHEMIVWGGGSSSVYYPSGGRYDPVADTWVSIPGGGPSARGNHTAVWTGSRMIVWGGDNNGNILGDGASYDPATGAWTPLPSIGAPAARLYDIAAWTGSAMLIYGGSGATTGVLNNGAAFDPASGAWTAFGQLAGAYPENRTAVWSGSEVIFWGTSGGNGRYDPVLDAWRPISTAGAPIGYGGHTAVWTGSRMVVWGGTGLGDPLASGGRYDPVTDTWQGMQVLGAPSARTGHTAVWTGSQVIVYGGSTSGAVNTGGRYDPVQDTWTTIASGPGFGGDQTAVWTGSLMLMYKDVSYKYDPVSDTWAQTAFQPGVIANHGKHTAVWTGSRMIIWGGELLTGSYSLPNHTALYDPVANSWSLGTDTGAPAGREGHTAVWTGTYMIIWGGTTTVPPMVGPAVSDGARYDPVRNTWSPLSNVGAPAARAGHKAVWDGTGMMIYGGANQNVYKYKGGRYIASVDADHDGFTVCGGDCNDANAAIHPGAAELCNGVDDNCNGLVDDAPDADGDGYDTACGGDCNDANAAVHPGAAELCNGLDDDCNGIVDDAPDADGDGAGACFDCNDADPTVKAVPAAVANVHASAGTPTVFTWDSLASQAGPATTYDTISGTIPVSGAFDPNHATCLGSTASTSFSDSRPFGFGTAGFWYLTRGHNACGAGTFGTARADAIGACP